LTVLSLFVHHETHYILLRERRFLLSALNHGAYL
jgi:hypothetical protein